MTGASGFIGSALLRNLELDGVDVRTLTRRPLPRANHLIGDVCDETALRKLIDGAEVVVHLAAYVHRRVRSAAERAECFAVNAGSTQMLANVVSENADPPHLIFISSASVYAPSHAAIVESSQLQPDTPYGEAKLEGERAVAAIGGTILRPAMVFGPGAPGNLQRLLRMIRTRVVVEVDRGRQRKSLVPVADLVAAIRAVARGRYAEAFNVSSSVLTMREIVDELAGALSIRALRLPVPRIATRLARSLPPLTRLVDAYTSDVILDDSKLRALAGYAPVADVRATLRDVALAHRHERPERDRG